MILRADVRKYTKDEFRLHCVEISQKSKIKAKLAVNDCEADFQIDTGEDQYNQQKICEEKSKNENVH
jgi:hypothetical protein